MKLNILKYAILSSLLMITIPNTVLSAEIENNDGFIPITIYGVGKGVPEGTQIVTTASGIEEAQREAIPSMTVITRETIENKKATSVIDILMDVPGLNIANLGGSGKASALFLRGASSNQVLIMIDGIPVRDESSTGSPLEFQHMSPDQIDHIEIVRGNVSAIYGSGAIGGVINFITRQGEGKPTVNATVGYGTYGTSKVNAGVQGKHEGTRFALSATHMKTDGFSAMNSKKDVPAWGYAASQDDDKDRTMTVSASVSQELLKGHEVGLRIYGFDSKTAYDDEYKTAEDRDWMKSKLYTFTAFSKNQFTDNWRSAVDLTYTKTDREYLYRYKGQQRQTSSEYQSEATQLRWNNDIKLADTWILSAGTEYQYEKADVGSYAWGTSIYGGSRTNYAAHAGLRGKVNRHDLQVNVRYDHVEDAGSDTTGFLGYGFNITDKWKFIASASTSFLAPTLYQQLDPLYGNKGLESEKATSYESGFQFATGNTLARITYFNTRTRDLIGFDADYRMINIDKAKNQGIELTAQTKIWETDLSGNITIQDPKNRETDKPLVRRSKQMLNFAASRQFGKFYIGGNVHYQRHTKDSDYSIDQNASYALVNLNARYDIDKHVQVFARLDNVFDKDYETAYGYNQTGRALFAGVSFKY